MRGLSLAPVEKLPLGERTLSLGAKGQDVRELQKILVELGLLSTTPRGEYDFLTREAVKNFQRAFHLAADGVAGPKTLRMLEEPAVWNHECYRLGNDGDLRALSVRCGVSVRAWKDPAGRRRIRRAAPGDRLLLEKREVWLAREEALPENWDFCTRLLQENAPPGKSKTGYRVFALGSPFLTEEQVSKTGVVVDLRTAGRFSGKRFRDLRLLSRRIEGEVFWWFGSGGGGARPPKKMEADGILFSPAIQVAESCTHETWKQEVKSLLARYPCTRLLLHFDLRGWEVTPSGERRRLSPGESRAFRLFRSGRLQRLGEYGWLYLQSRRGEEESRALIPDRNTVRGILDNIDRLNLRGVLFTGSRGLEPVIEKESAQFFLVLPGRRS